MPKKINVELIRLTYQQTNSITEVTKITGYNFRTIKKQILDLTKPKVPVDQVIKVYSVCGSLKKTGRIVALSTTQVWRILTKAGVPIGKSRSWKRLYGALRARVGRSEWRKRILERDNYCCVRCGHPSNIVHHKTKLSDIRDQVMVENIELNPLESFRDLRKFTDLVLEKHEYIDGEVLCSRCHNLEHSKPPEGGTYNCVNYAVDEGREIVRIDPSKLM